MNLVAEILKGNEEAFGIFYKSEFANIVYFVRGYLHDASLAEDIAQDSLLSLWEARASLDKNKNLRTYVFTIARNKALNVLKSKYFRENADNRNEVMADIAALEDPVLSHSLDALSMEVLIKRTLDSLSPAVRETFAYTRFEGLTNQEAADRSGVSLGTVEYRMSIALKKFRKKLKDYMMTFLWGIF